MGMNFESEGESGFFGGRMRNRDSKNTGSQAVVIDPTLSSHFGAEIFLCGLAHRFEPKNFGGA